MKTRLTKSEMEIMEVLWDEGKALTTSEIIQRSKEKEIANIKQFVDLILKIQVIVIIIFNLGGNYGFVKW